MDKIAPWQCGILGQVSCVSVKPRHDPRWFNHYLLVENEEVLTEELVRQLSNRGSNLAGISDIRRSQRKDSTLIVMMQKGLSETASLHVLHELMERIVEVYGTRRRLPTPPPDPAAERAARIDEVRAVYGD